MAYRGPDPKIESLLASESLSGAAVNITAYNTSNTASSQAVITAKVGGTSADDAKFIAGINGSTTWAWGLDNSDSDAWVLSANSTLGVNRAIRVDTTGAVTFDSSIRTTTGLFSTSTGFGTLLSGAIVSLHSDSTAGALTNYVYANSASIAPKIQLGHSRASGIGTNTIVQSGDLIGQIDYLGANGSTFDPAASIRAYVDGTPGSSSDMPGRLEFYTTADGSATPTKQMTISNTGLVTLTTGLASSTAIGSVIVGGGSLATAAGFSMNSVGSGSVGQLLDLNHSESSNPVTASAIRFNRSRGSTINGTTIVQSGDQLGSIQFQGANGTGFTPAAQIVVAVDGTPGATSDMPGRIEFYTTADGAGGTTKRLTIDSTGLSTFTGGIALPNTADSSSLAYYSRATTSSTFKFNGASGGTTSSVTIVTQRIGDFVRIYIPQATVNVGTGTNTALRSQTALPAAYRPATVTQTIGICPITNNGAATTTPGSVEIDTSGIIIISRDFAATAFTNSATGGIAEGFSCIYYVGTGS